MKKKSILLFLYILIMPLFIFTQESKIKHSVEVGITVEPVIEDNTVPRGVTFNYLNFITSSFNWGISGRFINQDYSYLWGNIGYNINITDSFKIPLETGIGVKINDLSLSDVEDSQLNSFIHASTGLNWNFDPVWNYFIHITYNYELLNNNESDFFITLGTGYLF